MTARESFITDVLDVYWRADVHDSLWWSTQNGELKLFAICNDLFYWATADLEEITADDVDLLRETRNELAALEDDDMGELYLSELFAARKRGMRPQRPCYKTWSPVVAALFDACGPQRDPKDEG